MSLETRIRYKGRYFRKKEVDRRETVKKVTTERWKKLRNASFNEKRDVSNAVEGNRIVNVKTLGRNLRCNCKASLSLENIISENRKDFHSEFTIECDQCKVRSVVHTGEFHKVNSLAADHLADKLHNNTTTNSVLGTIHAGVGCTELNKILACSDIPTISSKLYKKYEQELCPVIEENARKSFRKSASVERNLVLDKLKELQTGALKIEAIIIKDVGEGEALEETVIVVKSKSDDRKIPCVAVPVEIGTVITVGSCIKDLVNPFMKCDDLAIGKTNNKGKVIGVENLYLADSYGKNSQSHIAVLKLAETLDFSSVSAIALPKFGSSYNNKVGQLTTYVRSEQDPTFNLRGSPFYTISSDWFLKTMPIKIQGNCLKSEDDSQLCGRSLSQEKDQTSSSCNDHLGGLLVVDNEIVGILSKSNALCNDDESATIYTIPQLFIRNNLDNNSSENINHCKPPT